MLNNVLSHNIENIHFVGIGGAGMSGIAEVLLNLGYKISGSDLQPGVVTQRLQQLGANIFVGHSEANVTHTDVVVVSSAIPAANPEVVAAKSLHIPVVPRAEMLAELMRFRYGIAIAGTHGKTTTTSLIASVLAEGGLDPTFVIGGKLNSAESNASLGQSNYFVAEVDESDASFLLMHPLVAVVTNIDADHMATYNNSFENLKQSFVKFLQRLPFYGVAVMCLDDPAVADIIPAVTRPIVTYGFSPEADLVITNYVQENLISKFNVTFKGEALGEYNLSIPGKHNVLNAAATIAVALELGVELEAVQSALLNFKGVGRRFQLYGDFKVNSGNVSLVDDYGHHPTEIAATIAAARSTWPDRRLVMIFQPHRYSRTRDLFDDFIKVLAKVDIALVLDIYAAGESPINGIDSKKLCSNLRQFTQAQPIHIASTTELYEALPNVLSANDIILTQGAGSIGAIATELANDILVKV